MRIITSSEIRAFAKCRIYWNHKYVDGTDPVGYADQSWFVIGNAIHKALEDYHGAGRTREQVKADAVQGVTNDTTRERILGCIETYFEFWDHHPLDGEFLGAETPFLFPLFPEEDVWISGIRDGDVRNADGSYSVFETKTTGMFTNLYFWKLGQDFQTHLYALAMSRDKRYADGLIKSVYYNVINSKRHIGEPYVKADGTLSTKRGKYTSLKRAEAALGVTEDNRDLIWGKNFEALDSLQRKGYDPFVIRKEHLLTAHRMQEFFTVLKGTVRAMIDNPLLYPNTSSCDDAFGCPYAALCGVNDPRAPSEFATRKHLHPELEEHPFRESTQFDLGDDWNIADRFESLPEGLFHDEED